MLNTLSEIVWGSELFGFGYPSYPYVGNPAIFIFGYPIYLYALIIVTGMALAILITGFLFKKRGYDPYDVTIYALAVIPLGVLGARVYVYVFPWSNISVPDWSTFFQFRHGGLGIYGGVIVGYITAYVVAKIKKQDFRIVADCIMPGLFLAQSIGRWGNFANQEAFGNLVTNPNLQFFPYAVYIDAHNAWYQATFFYESFCTFIGFLVCILVLNRSKKYKLGWCTAFYGIYYGIVRLVIEGLRSDSLFLYIGTMETDIKISQLVSICAIIMGLWTLSKIYRQSIHKLYSKLFVSERQEVSISRFLLAGVAVVLAGVAVTMYVLGGASRFIIGSACALLAVYCILGIFALCDRLKLYCPTCGKRNEPVGGVITLRQQAQVTFVMCIEGAVALVAFGTFSLVVWGIIGGIPNGVVLAVICYALTCVVTYTAIQTYGKIEELPVEQQGTSYTCCNNEVNVRLNKFLLWLFPYKVYADYGVDNIVPWVDPEKETSNEE